MFEREYWEDTSGGNAPGDSGDDVAAEAGLDLAIRRREAGDLTGSLRMLRRLVVERTRRQGRKGFDTQCALSQAGRTLRAMGRAAEACDLHWEVLAIRFEQYGRSNSYTRNSAGILADTLVMLNDREMAASLNLWQRAPGHPSDRVAIQRVDDRLRAALAARQSQVMRQVAAMVRDYVRLPIHRRVREPKRGCESPPPEHSQGRAGTCSS